MLLSEKLNEPILSGLFVDEMAQGAFSGRIAFEHLEYESGDELGIVFDVQNGVIIQLQQLLGQIDRAIGESGRDCVGSN